MECLITDFSTAQKLTEEKPSFYRVVSISSPLEPIKNFINAKEVLHLYFDDIINNSKSNLGIIQLTMATEIDCQKALDFLNKNISDPCLVHCYHGRSRSTAIALGFFLQEYKNYEIAIEKLLDIQPWATPNEHILKLMCSIHKQEKQYLAIIDCLQKKRTKFLTTFKKGKK